MSRINGSKSVRLETRETGHDENGFFTNETYYGGKTAIYTRAFQFEAIGATVSVTELPGGMARLTIRLSWLRTDNGQPTEAPIEMWELEPQEVEKDLLDADFPNSLLPALSKDDRKSLATLIANPGFIWDGDPEADLPDGTVIIPDDPTTCYSIYLLMSAGIRAFPIDAHTIRHTQTVSNRYSTQVSFSNVNRILSRATFIATEGVPSDLLFSIPIPPTVSQFIQFAGDLQYGWRKLMPQVSEAALQKRQIVTAFQFGLWSTTLYGAVL